MRKLPDIKVKKLDIGCANQCKDGFAGIDNVDYGQPIIWDVRDGIPFPDNSIEEVYTSHFLEHLTNKEGKAFTEEVLRVLKPGGTFYNKLPSVTHYGAFYQDHESFWNEARVKSLANPDNMPGWEIVSNITLNEELQFRLKKI